MLLSMLVAMWALATVLEKQDFRFLKEKWGITQRGLKEAHQEQFQMKYWSPIYTTYNRTSCFSYHTRYEVCYQRVMYDEIRVTFVGYKRIPGKYTIITGHGTLHATWEDGEGREFVGATELGPDEEWVYSDKLTHITLLSPRRGKAATVLG